MEGNWRGKSSFPGLVHDPVAARRDKVAEETQLLSAEPPA